MKTPFALVLTLGTLAISNLFAAPTPPTPDAPWPRQRTSEKGTLIFYQPQVDAWTNFKDLDFRMAFSLTPKGGKEVIGILEGHALTDVDVSDHRVVLNHFQIKGIKFPGLDPAKASQMSEAIRSFIPANYTTAIALSRLVAGVEKSQAPPAGIPVQNDPPTIFVSATPAILLNVDGEAKRADIAGTNLGFVVNSNFPLFFQKDGPQNNYLFTGQLWLKSSSMEGGWSPAGKLPADFTKVANDPQWTQMKQPILSPSAPGKPPTVFFSSKPAEVILFQGEPAYAAIPGIPLLYAKNTDAEVFFDEPNRTFYYLAAGRWFRATNLKGPWTFATPDLPADFAKIPANSPAARVLASVPGTEEAKDAVLLAQIPTTATVDPTTAAAQAKVSYSGNPEFKPIEGTSMQYAVNTADKVIKVGDVYYLCLQGVWFLSPSANGPWSTATSVPKEIYSIPPSSPVYNVTYVTQSTTPTGTIQASYTAGYLGTFIAGAAAGAILASGTGYYYPPYYGYPVGAYPVYHPYAATYGAAAYYHPYAYGTSAGVYGPYHGAAAGAAYNPYTGTYARGATAYGPYGKQSVAQAYNPYTGTYAATHQGSNAYSSWGQSVVSHDGNTAYTQHYSNANGTAATAQTSKGGEAAGVNTKYGDTAAGKTSNGNMYATHDGNVYKNTGSGWSSYDNGHWNSAQKPASSSAEAHPSSYHPSGSSEMDHEAQARARGGASSERFQQAAHRGGGGFERGGGGRRR
jgi:hypothetical protein